MYQVNHVIKLDGKKFYDISVWNLLCRKKILSILLLVVYGMGLSSIASSMPALKAGNTNGFIINAGLGLIMVIMAIYLCYSNVDRMKRVSRNQDYLQKTEKHIKMDEDQIINYRSSVDEQIIYKWDQVAAVYDRPEDIVLCMKDQQMLLFEKEKLAASELDFIRAKAEVRQLWKKSVSMKLWIAIAAAITVLIVLGGAFLYIYA